MSGGDIERSLKHPKKDPFGEKALFGWPDKRSPAKVIEPSPVATAMPGREVDEAKKKVRKRSGRMANILAGRMMTERTGNMKDIFG